MNQIWYEYEPRSLPYILGSVTSLEQLSIASGMNKLGLSSNLVFMKKFYAFVSFWFSKTKIGHTFRKKVHSKTNWWKYVIIKSCATFFIFLNEQKTEGFGRFLTLKIDFEKHNCVTFDLQNQKDSRPRILLIGA